MNLFLIGLAARDSCEPGPTRDALAAVVEELPFFDAADIDSWAAPSEGSCEFPPSSRGLRGRRRIHPPAMFGDSRRGSGGIHPPGIGPRLVGLLGPQDQAVAGLAGAALWNDFVFPSSL